MGWCKIASTNLKRIVCVAKVREREGHGERSICRWLKCKDLTIDCSRLHWFLNVGIDCCRRPVSPFEVFRGNGRGGREEILASTFGAFLWQANHLCVTDS